MSTEQVEIPPLLLSLEGEKPLFHPVWVWCSRRSATTPWWVHWGGCCVIAPFQPLITPASSWAAAEMCAQRYIDNTTVALAQQLTPPTSTHQQLTWIRHGTTDPDETKRKMFIVQLAALYWAHQDLWPKLEPMIRTYIEETLRRVAFEASDEPEVKHDETLYEALYGEEIKEAAQAAKDAAEAKQRVTGDLPPVDGPEGELVALRANTNL